MHKAFLSTLACGLMMGSAATADQKHFEHAFYEACFLSLPNLDFVMQELPSPEWQKTEGADPGEFEFYSSGTSVFLAMDGSSQGCTVMDESISQNQAETILEGALVAFLADNSPSYYERGFDHNNRAVWTLHMEELVIGTPPINFYVDEGLGGGAAIIIVLN